MKFKRLVPPLILLLACFILMNVFFACNARAETSRWFTAEDCKIPDLGLDPNKNSPMFTSGIGWDAAQIIYGQMGSDDYIEMKLFKFKTDKDLAANIGGYNDVIGYYQGLQAPDIKNMYKWIYYSDGTGPDHKIYYLVRPVNQVSKDNVFGMMAFYNGTSMAVFDFHLKGYSDETAIATVNKVEAKARELLNMAATRVTIAYYDPFAVETLKKSGHVGGDVVVSVMKDGKPVADQDVYLFLSDCNYMPDNNAILFPNIWQHDSFILYGSGDVPDSAYMKVTTDASGQATWNYVHSGAHLGWGCIDYNLLRDALKNNGNISYKLSAVVYSKDPLTGVDATNKAIVVGKASIPLEIKGVAAITDLKAVGYYMTPTQGATPVLQMGEAKVRVMNDKGSKGVYPADLPYYLKPGDKVLFAWGNYAGITFITGEKFHVKPNIGTIMDRLSDPETPLASLEIGKKDLGWYRWLSSEHFHVFELSVSGAHTVLEGVFGGLAAAAEGVPAHAVFAIFSTAFFQGGQTLFDPLDVSAESVILISPGNDSVNVSTFEGKAHLYDFTRNVTIDVPAGQQVIVSNDKSTGHNSFGPVTAFSENAVNSSDLDLVNLAEGKASTTATATPQQPSPKGSSPAPGIVAAAMAVLAVVFLMRKRRGE